MKNKIQFQENIRILVILSYWSKKLEETMEEKLCIVEETTFS